MFWSNWEIVEWLEIKSSYGQKKPKLLSSLRDEQTIQPTRQYENSDDDKKAPIY